MSAALIELSALIDKLQLKVTDTKASADLEELRAIERKAMDVGKSSSGSWLGYHANVYWRGFGEPPPGKHFDVEHGIGGDMFVRPDPNWIEYSSADVQSAILGQYDALTLLRGVEKAQALTENFESTKQGVLGIIGALGPVDRIPGGQSILKAIEDARIPSKPALIDVFNPKRQIITGDHLALNQGPRAPTWVVMAAEAQLLRAAVESSDRLLQSMNRLAMTLRLQAAERAQIGRSGVNVFIGHGRAPAWRELKDFVQERLGLPYDEFNRVPVAGLATTHRLQQMLDAAAVAFIVMTAEDESADGRLQARMNVIHEAGLFQGRLGFEKTFLLLEEGCEEFSNIHGLGQIRFPKGRISAIFEDVRGVLERERLVTP